MEASIVTMTKVKSGSKLFRFDAEYFRSEYMKTEELIKKKNYIELRNLISLLTDYHANGSYETLRANVHLSSEPDYAHMIRTVDIEKDDFENDIISISEHAYNFLNKTKVYGGEIIINKIGNAGNVYLIPPVERKTSLGMNQFMIRTNNKVNNYYLYCYLAGRYGQNQLRQRITGAVPLSIDKESVRSILVPIFSSTFEEIVSDFISINFEYAKKAKQLFKEAQSLLLSELGLTNWKPKRQLSFIKSLSDTQQTDRADAEYFQPKYDKILSALWKRNGLPLHKIASVKKGYQARCDLGSIPYASIKDIKANLIETNELAKFSKKLVTIDFNDLALAITGATIGKVGININKKKTAICGDLLKIRAKGISPYYLLAVLGLPIITELCKRNITGMTNGHLSADVVKEFPIPILEDKVIGEIDKEVRDSFSLRRQAQQSLGCAKQAVEIAIEQDEEIAIKWLQLQENKKKTEQEDAVEFCSAPLHKIH